MTDTKKWIMHNDAIFEFNERLYNGVFSQENITSTKKCISIGDSTMYGYYLEKGKSHYFMDSEFINHMPFRIISKTETDYKGDVFEIITEIEPVTVPTEKRMSFRELVDLFPAFEHSNPRHFTLYKIIALAAYLDRVNYRVSTDAGFGKDSVAGIISGLVDSTANLYGATFAKLEYVLYNTYIILNELGNLKKDELINMQEFLLATGAYHNKYTKRTRRTKSTQEEYDISKTSIIVFYNLPSYYIGKAQEFFDQMFTSAVLERFIPFVFEGGLTARFDTVIDPGKVVEDNMDLYKDIIATIQHYKSNIVKEIKYEVNTDHIAFPKKLNRYDRSFNILLKYVSEYANSQEEFDVLSCELFDCYTKYEELLVKTRTLS